MIEDRQDTSTLLVANPQVNSLILGLYIMAHSKVTPFSSVGSEGFDHNNELVNLMVKLVYDDEVDGSSENIFVAYPETLPFQLNVRDNIAKYIFGDRTANRLFALLKSVSALLSFVFVCSGVVMVYYFLMPKRSSLLLLISVVLFNFSCYTNCLFYTMQLLSFIKDRFEFQFSVVNLVLSMGIFTIIDSSVNRAIVMWGFFPPILLGLGGDSYVNHRITMIGAIVCVIFASIVLLVMNHNTEAETTTFTIDGKVREFSLIGVFNSCWINLFLVGIRTAILKGRYSGTMVSAKSSITSIEWNKSSALAMCRYSKMLLEAAINGGQFDGKLKGVVKDDDPLITAVVVMKSSFTYSPNQALGWNLSRRIMNRVSSSTYSRLYVLHSTSSCIYMCYRLSLNTQQQSSLETINVSLVWVLSGIMLLNANPKLVHSIRRSFEALFVLFNFFALMVGLCILFNDSSKIGFISILIPMVAVGIMSDAFEERKIVSVGFLATGACAAGFIFQALLRNIIEVEDVEREIGFLKISVLNRCFNCLFNLIFWFSKQLTFMVFHSERFMFVKASFKIVKMRTSTLQMLYFSNPIALKMVKKEKGDEYRINLVREN